MPELRRARGAGLAAFAGVAIPAAVVNSGLRFMQKQIQLAFMRRLTHKLHSLYCSKRAYYSASVLGGAAPALGPPARHAMCLPDV